MAKNRVTRVGSLAVFVNASRNVSVTFDEVLTF
jgi:hypothetical protein